MEKKMNNYVKFNEFKKLNLLVGQIKAVKDHPDADKLYILLVDFGKEESDVQIVAGIKQYKKQELVGKKIIVVRNLEPATIRGVESNGMLLAAEKGDKISLITIDKDIELGAKIH